MIRADGKEIADLARELARVVSDVPAVFAQSAGNVAKLSGPIAISEVTAIYNLPQKRAESSINSRAQGPIVYTFAKARAPSLKEFGGAQVARGYQAEIKHGKRRLVRGGFAAAKFAGLPLKRVGKERYPLKVLYGPKVSSMLRNREVSPRFALRQADAARAELTRQMFTRLDRR